MPVLDALKTYPKEIALAAGSFVATHATFYIVSVWLISYATMELGYDRTAILNANAALSLSDIPMILSFGLLSDYVGRRKMFLTGMALLGLFAVPYFMLVSTSNIWLFLLGGLIVQACRSAVYGPQSAYFAEQFSTTNALQRQLAGLSVRRDPRRHGAADLHRARRRDRKRVRGGRVRDCAGHDFLRQLLSDDRNLSSASRGPKLQIKEKPVRSGGGKADRHTDAGGGCVRGILYRVALTRPRRGELFPWSTARGRSRAKRRPPHA